MGAWHFVYRRIERALAGLNLKATRAGYIGRPESASPATGSARTHVKEQADLVDRALTIARSTTGFIYYVSVAGITGERKALPPELAEQPVVGE